MLDQLLIIFIICLVTPILMHWSQILNMGKYRVTRCDEIKQKIRIAAPHQDFLKLNSFNFNDSFKYKNIELGL